MVIFVHIHPKHYMAAQKRLLNAITRKLREASHKVDGAMARREHARAMNADLRALRDDVIGFASGKPIPVEHALPGLPGANFYRVRKRFFEAYFAEKDRHFYALLIRRHADLNDKSRNLLLDAFAQLEVAP